MAKRPKDPSWLRNLLQPKFAEPKFDGSLPPGRYDAMFDDKGRLVVTGQTGKAKQ